VITRYYFGGAYETTVSEWKRYYSVAGQTIMRTWDVTHSTWNLTYFLSDHLGSTSVVLSPDGDDPDTELDVEQPRYLPFGEARVMPPYASITSTDFIYTGLMDYNARY
jgi:hypothetical protein